MTDLIRRFKGFGIAIAVLALSAGVVFAAAPHATPQGAPVAAEEPTDGADGDESETPDADAPDEDTDGDETDTPDAEAPAEDAADTHGTLVSQAAAMETPAGFDNHGQFVSCVARLNHGQWAGGTPAEPVVLADLTPELCAALADEAAAAKAEAKSQRAAEREAAKAERSAERAAASAERAASKAARAAAKAAREAAREAAGH